MKNEFAVRPTACGVGERSRCHGGRRSLNMEMNLARVPSLLTNVRWDLTPRHGKQNSFIWPELPLQPRRKCSVPCTPAPCHSMCATLSEAGVPSAHTHRHRKCRFAPFGLEFLCGHVPRPYSLGNFLQLVQAGGVTSRGSRFVAAKLSSHQKRLCVDLSRPLFP